MGSLCRALGGAESQICSMMGLSKVPALQGASSSWLALAAMRKDKHVQVVSPGPSGGPFSSVRARLNSDDTVQPDKNVVPSVIPPVTVEMPAHWGRSRGRSRASQPVNSKNPSGLSGGSTRPDLPQLNTVDSALLEKNVVPSGANPATAAPHARRGRSRARSRAPLHRNAAAPALPQRSWAAIAKSAEKGYALTYIPPNRIDGCSAIRVPDEIL
ncbi:uncharacterized protein J3R85_016642 [Psidium guajava]|nr:uncharacterized protein J3R85_016642 [Psidium guajava]